MTAISPTAGIAPLGAVAPPQQSISLHQALAAGTNLGGALATGDSGMLVAPAPGAAPVGVAVPATGTSASGGGVTAHAAQGAAAVSEPQLIAVLEQVVAAVTQLVAVLQAQQVAGGGAPGSPGASVGQCGMPGCTMDHGVPVRQGASAAPSASTPVDAPARRPAAAARRATAAGDGRPGGGVDPKTVKDKASTQGLTQPAMRGLHEAHRFGLPLVSGKRTGGAPGSDHAHGNAIDVGNLPIGAAGSSRGTPQMQAYAEHMRLEGRAGRLDVKYVIADGRIASATGGWTWRDYNYPGKTDAQLAALKASNPGEYNRLQHYDHVHVSFS